MQKAPAIAALPESEETFLTSVEDARKSLDEGHGVDLEDIAPWLLSWGTDEELPAPESE